MPKTSEESARSRLGGPSQEGATVSASASSGGFGGYQLRTDPMTGAKIIEDKSVAMVVFAEFYNLLPEWKMKQCLGFMSHYPVDLEEIEKWSGFRFATPELVEIYSSAIATLAGGVVEVTNPTRTRSTSTAAEMTEHSQNTDGQS